MWDSINNILDKATWCPGPTGTIAGLMKDGIEVGLAIHTDVGALKIAQMVLTKAAITGATGFIGGKFGGKIAAKITMPFGNAMQKMIAKSCESKVYKFTAKYVGKFFDLFSKKLFEKGAEKANK